MATSNSLSHEHVARLAGLSIRRVEQLVRDSRGPKQAADGRFLPEDVGAWLRDRIKGELGISDDGSPTLEAARIRLTNAQSDKTELEVAELSGDLVRSDEVIEAWGARISAARGKLLSLPAKLAPRVAAPERLAETELLIRNVVHEVLSELAGDGLPERTRARREAKRGDLDAPAAADGKPVGGRGKAPVERVKRRAREVADGAG